MKMGHRSFLDQSGAAAAEMALMLPLLLMLLFGAFEGAHFLWSEHKVVKGVRDGARYAARHGFSNYTCPTTVDAGLITPIQNVTRTGYPDGDNPNVSGTDNPTVPGWANADVTVTLTCNGAVNTGLYESTIGGAPIVTVAASVPYPSLFGMVGFDTTAVNLNARSQAAVMGI